MRRISYSNGRQVKLVAHTAEGKEVQRGDPLKSFRDEAYFFIEATQANDEAHDGKVLVEDDKGMQREFYARVVSLTVEAQEVR